MPAGAVGASWVEDSWLDTAWEADSWGAPSDDVGHELRIVGLDVFASLPSGLAVRAQAVAGLGSGVKASSASGLDAFASLPSGLSVTQALAAGIDMFSDLGAGLDDVR